MQDFRVKTFLTVCRTLNYTRAAEELALTQPAVSQHITYLEREYGAKLFTYHRKKLELTPAGRVLRDGLATMAHDDVLLHERIEEGAHGATVKLRSGMTLTGTANSATGTTLTSVQVAILDAADQTVQSAAAQANAAAFSLNTLDSQIRFGELPEGSYSYMVLVTDSTGESLCFASDFTVSGSASSTQTYWSVKDAEGTKLQQTVQQMETTVETAAETTVSWFAKLFD